MKHGKKPTRAEKKILVKNDLDPTAFLIIKRLSNELHVVNRTTEELIIIEV